MAALAATAVDSNPAPYFGAYPESLHAALAIDRLALERERELCAGGRWRFDPGLLLRVEESGWGTGPAPQRLLYHAADGLIAVSDRPERLAALIAAGPVPAMNGRGQLQDRLFGWIARRVCEAVSPRYNCGADSPVPERWAQALVVHYLGTVTLSPDALEAYRERQPVNAAQAGADGKNRDVTKVLDRIKHTLQGAAARLAAEPSQQCLLDAISRAVAAALLHQGGADGRQIQRMVLGAADDYQIEQARR